MICFRVTENERLKDIIQQQVERLSLQSEQMLILVGAKDEQIKSLENISHIALSAQLCEKLLPMTSKSRAEEVESVLQELFANEKEQLLLLDRIQILFETSLQIDVLRCLKNLSKQKTLIINWPGAFDGNRLSFSAPGKADYFNYSESDISSVPVLWLTGNGEQK